MISSVLLVAALALPCATSSSLRAHIPQHVIELGQHGHPSHGKRELGDIPTIAHLVPSYPGFGTHFAYLYVGTPPQRQAVILDTAQAWTAFPCSKCKDCGKHLDEYFNPSNSESFKESVCNNTKCFIKNTYSTAQWTAYKGNDKTFIAGNDVGDVTDATDFTFPLTFGCMRSANGAMQDQAADGVLGLANAADALPFQYSRAAKVDEVFSLCLRQGGGILTLGGMDATVASSGHALSYTRLSEEASNGFWRVKVDQMRFETHGSDKKYIDIGTAEDMVYMDQGKGTIIDSGTSQTYFPKKIGAAMSAAFKEATGFPLSKQTVKLSDKQIKNMPTLLISFRSDADNDKTFTIKMPASDYLETDGSGNYNIMLDATENYGAVLGANFLDGYNVIFDKKKQRVGFVESECRYADFHDVPEDSAPPTNDGRECGDMRPVTECTARCLDGQAHSTNYAAAGVQDWSNDCVPETRQQRPCHVSCSAKGYEITAPENILCELPPWSECSSHCEQTQTHRYWKGGKCQTGPEIKRQCYAGQCPTKAQDYLIFIDLKFYFEAPWSSAVSEDIFEAIGSLFDINPGNVEALVDNGAYVGYKKVQIQIRLRAQAYLKLKAAYGAMAEGERIIDLVNSRSFTANLVDALNRTSVAKDHVDFSRFGWMIPEYDVVLLSATGFPVSSKDKNPDYLVDGTAGSGSASAREEQLQLILIGVVLAGFIIIGFMGCLYCRLRRQYWNLEKDKGLPGNLKAMWESYRAKQKYKKVRTMEMTQTVDSPFDADEFDDALDQADDVNG